MTSSNAARYLCIVVNSIVNSDYIRKLFISRKDFHLAIDLVQESNITLSHRTNEPSSLKEDILNTHRDKARHD